MVKKKKEETEEEGFDLDDAFADDDDVDYAPSKPKKEKKKSKGVELEDLSESEGDCEEGIKLIGGDISKVKKGDIMKVDGVNMEVDAHYILIEHGNGINEMVIEVFDPKKDKDYQLRYFSNRIKESAEFFELDEIVYNRKNVKKIEW